MVISGIISEVNEYEVKLSLPCHLVATLPITNISSTLTEILRYRLNCHLVATLPNRNISSTLTEILR